KGEAIHVWDLATGQERHPFAAHDSMIRSVAFSPDGRTLATSAAGAIRLWETREGKPTRALGELLHGTTSLSFSPDGRTLLAGGSNAVHSFDPATGTEVRKTPLSGEILALAPDGRTAATMDEADRVFTLGI